MTNFTFIRYFVPDGNEFISGWYQTYKNDGRTRIGDVPLNLSDSAYDALNRVIIDELVPTDSIVNGGGGHDEFVITSLANSVVIDDTSENNTIVFERDVSITSIERLADPEASSVGLYVITLSSGKTITLKNSARFTFQHFGDDTRTAAISAEDFFTAHEDGFQPLDAPLSDIIGTASGPSGAQEPLMITGVFSREVTEGTTDAIVGILNNNMGATVSVVLRDDGDGDGALEGEYGTITFVPSDVGGAWTYTLDNTNTEVNALGEGDRLSDIFIFTISGVSGSDLTVTIVIIGVNDDPESGTAIVNAGGTQAQSTTIDLSTLFIDPDNDVLALTFTATLAENEITQDENNVLSYDADTKILTIKLAEVGEYTIGVEATDGGAGSAATASFTFTVVKQQISGDNTGSVTEDDPDNTPATGTLTKSSAAWNIALTGNGVTTKGVDTFMQEGTYGTMTFVTSTTGGTWSYVLDSTHAAVQELGVGDTLSEKTFIFTSTGAASDFAVAITINGANDVPVLGRSQETINGQEGRALESINLLDLFNDPDGDELDLTVTATFNTVEIDLDEAGFTHNTNDATKAQTFSGAPHAAGTYVITVVAEDEDGATATSTFTIQTISAQERIQITGDHSGTLTEDDTTPVTGVLAVSLSGTFPIFLRDDTGADGVLKGTYGTMTFNQTNNTWSYAVDNSNTEVNALGVGASLSDSFVFAIQDRNSVNFEVTIVINGVNDDPKRGTDIEGLSGTQGQNTAVDLGTLFTDPDGDILDLTFTVMLGGTAITLDEDNTLSYDRDTRVLTIKLADIGEYTIGVEATDGGTGPAVTSEFTFTVVEIQISGDGEGSVTEDDPGNTPAMGTLTRSNASTSLELTGEGVVNDGAGTFTLEGKYGTMTFVVSASGGDWSYVLDSTHVDVQGLGVGDTLSDETFVFTTTGVSSDFIVTITIEGDNDAPVLARSQGTIEGLKGRALESINLLDLFNDPDGDELELTVTATFNESAISLDDAGFTHTINIEDQTQTFSGTPQANGTYVITVVAEDEGGATATSTFIINAAGGTPPQLRPISSGNNQANQPTLNEDDTSYTGSLVIFDFELDPLPDIVIENADESGVFRGLYGSVSIEKTGLTDAGRAGSEIWEWTYTLDERAQALGVFKDGDPIPFESFSFIPGGNIPDALNAQIEIRIVGANDAPVVDEGVRSVIDGQARKVDKVTPPIDLSALFRDPEGDEITLSITSVTFGGNAAQLSTTGFVYNSTDKTLSGAPNAAGDYVITIEATDSNNALSDATTFTISAVEDNPPEIGGTLTGAISEDSTTSITGVLTIEDADEGDTPPPIALLDGEGDYGTMLFNTSDNTWSYTLILVGRTKAGPITSVNTLAAGDTLTETFTFSAQDASPVQVIITINGANDAPEIGIAIEEQAGQENHRVTINLSTLFIDPDEGATLNLEFEVNGGPGGLAAIGLSYKESTDRAGNVIREIIGEPTVIGRHTIKVTASDGSESASSSFDLVVRADSPPEISGVDGVVDEETAPPVTGTLFVKDVDRDAGRITVTAENGQQTLVFEDELPNIVLDGADSITGILSGDYGTISLGSSPDNPPVPGDSSTDELLREWTWTYTLDNTHAAVQALGDGEVLTETFTFTANGADDHVLTITINGVNDAPEVGPAIVNQTGQTNHAITPIDLSGLFTDADAGDTLTLTFEVTLANAAPEEGPGDLTAIGLTYSERTDPDGNLIREITGEPDVLGTHTIKVTASDGSEFVTSSFTIEVVADNAPVISGAPGVIDENAEDPTVTGTLTIEDEDGDVVPAIVPPSTLSGDYGTLTFTPTTTGGTWSYALNNTQVEVQMLKDGDTLTETFIFTAEGAENYELTITINGANDVPVIVPNASIDNQEVRLNQDLTINLDGLFTDADNDDDELELMFAVTFADGSTGGLLSAGLSYRETTDPDGNLIREITGMPDVLGMHTIVVTAEDGDGGVSEALSFTINVIIEHPPVISNNNVDPQIGEDATDPIAGTLTVTDDNVGDTLPVVMLMDGLVNKVLVNSGVMSLKGDYGTLTLSGGDWLYTLDERAQTLKTADQVTETFIFTAEGAENYTLTITINGADDPIEVGPSIEKQDGQIAHEITINLSTLFTDGDGDELTLTFAVMLADGSTGDLATVGLSYSEATDPDGNLIREITGEPTVLGVHTIVVTATAGSESINASFTLEVAADNAPVISGVAGVIDEDAGAPATGMLTIEDDDGDAVPAIVPPRDLSGAYGTLNFTPTATGGTWSYVLDNTHVDVQGLGDGETLTETFVFTAEGAENHDLIITINGVNDAPELGPPIVDAAGTQGQNITVDLSALFTDADGDILDLTFTVMLGGTEVTLDEDNTLNYDRDTGILIIKLAVAGEYTIGVEATDGGSAPAVTSEFTLTVAVPLISGAAVGSVTEDDPSNTSATGTLTISDLSLSVELTGEGVETDDVSGTMTLVGLYGTMTFDPSASAWTYTLDPVKSQALRGPQDGVDPATETFTFAVGENDTFDVVITAIGVSDALELGTEIEEQAGLTKHDITINLSDLFTDPDEGDEFTLTFAVTLADGSTGDLAAIGLSYSETRDPITDVVTRLITGEPDVLGTHTITVTALGSNSEEVISSFDIVVKADSAPVITSDPAAAMVVEDADTPATGVLSIEDADEGDPLPSIVLDGADSVTGIRVGEYGRLAFNAATGEWTYRLDNTLADVNALGVGDTLTDTFTFSADGAENYDLTITINGANDAPEVGPDIEKQDGQIAHDITINLSDLFTDAEGDELTLTFAVKLVDGRTGDLSLIGLSYNETTDSVTNVVTRLITGEPTVLGLHTITITASDGSGSTSSSFSLEVVADNAPVISGIAGVIDEDAADPITGTLTIEDEDGDELPAILPPSDLSGDYGTLTFNATTREWMYTLDNTLVDVQGLGDGETLTETFTFTAEGAENYDLIITINGVNDAPELGTPIVDAAGTQGQNITVDLSALFTDADGDILDLTFTVMLGGTAITLDDDNTLSYDRDTRILTIKLAEAGEYTIGVEATDGGSAPAVTSEFTLTVAVPLISGEAVGSVTEDDPSNTSATGTLTTSDLSLSVELTGEGVETDDVSGTMTLVGLYGTMTFDPSTGVWTYTLDAVKSQALRGPQDGVDPATETFTFTAGENNTFDVVITAVGVNDALELGTEIEEQAGQTNHAITPIDLSGLFTDADEGDELTLTFAVTLADGSTGDLAAIGLSYSETTDPDGNLIREITGEPTVLGVHTIEVTGSDGSGSVSASFTVNIVADNAPVITSDPATAVVVEDADTPSTGILTIEDADEGDALPTIVLDGADSVTGVRAGDYGRLAFDAATGEWTYRLDNTLADVQALGVGDTLIDTFTFSAEGAENYELTITINGANESPEAGPPLDPINGTMGQAIQAINLSDLFTDADGDVLDLTLALTVTLDGVAVDLETEGTTITLGDSGLTYDTETNILSGIPSAEGTYKISVVATDADGASSEASEFDIVVVVQTITSTDPATGTVMEDEIDGNNNPITTVTGTLVRTPDLTTVTLIGDGDNSVSGTYGTMTFDPGTGVWTYTLDNNDENTEALGDEDQVEEVFTFVDSNGGARFAVTITVSGANDAPRVIDTGLPAISETIRETIEIDLSAFFTDVEGDELTFTVTLSDDSPLSMIGLSYDPDTKMITGALSQIGEHIIKVVADDGNGGTLEVTFNVEVLVAAPVIRNNGLTYNPDEEGIIIDETILKATSGNQLDPTLLVYTITTLPDAGVLSKSGTPLNNGGTFTQADINDGLITYVPSVSNSSTSQSNPLSFTFSDGVATLEDQTLEITSRVVFDVQNPEEDNGLDGSAETVPQQIEAGDGSDIITGGEANDYIDGGAGDDEITLTRDDNGEQVDAGADEVRYTFSYDGVGIDGGDEIVGFKRGQDKLKFIVSVERADITTLTEFLGSLNGADGDDLTADDAFIVTMRWGTDAAGDFYFDGVSLHFKDASAFGGGRISSPLVQITFDERLGLDDLVDILGGEDNLSQNFDFTHAAFKNFADVLPRLFGDENSIDFIILRPPVITPVNNADEVVEATGAVVEDDDGQNTATGMLIIRDADAADDDPRPPIMLNGATDDDNDGTFILESVYGRMEFVMDDGTWTYTLDNGKAETQALGVGENASAEDKFTFTAEGAEPVTVTITVNGANDEPVVDTAIDEQGGTVGQSTSIDLSDLFTDPDGDTLTLTVMVLSSDGTTKAALDTIGLAYDSDTQMITGTPTDSGTYTIEVVAEDGQASATSTFDIVVEEQTIEAIAGGSTAAVTEDDETQNSVTGTLGIISGVTSPAIVLDDATDDDNDGTFILESVYGRMEFVMSTGVWTYTLDNTKAETQALNTTDVVEDIFIFASGSARFAVTITVNGVDENQDPVVDTAIVEQGGTVGQSTSIDLSGLFTDPDGDTLTLTVMVLSSDGTTKTALDTIGLAHDSDTQMITGTPIGSGTYTIEVVAEDGEGGSETSTFNIVVVEQTIEATEGGSTAAVTEDDETQDSVTGTLEIISGVTSPDIVLNGATDDDNDGTFILESVYGRMEFVMDDGTWTYTLDNTKAETQALNATEVVEDIFIFTSGSAGFAVTITVNGADENQDPVVDNAIVDQGGTVGQSTSIDLSGLFTDPDGDSLTLTVMVLSSDGTTKTALDTIGLAHDSDTQMITGTPTGSGTYTIEVVAEDGNGGITAATFNIVVVEQTIEATAGGSTAAVTEDDEAQDSVTGTLEIISGVTSPAIVLNGATDDDNDGTFILEGVYGRMEFVMSTGVWTYTLDNTKAETQALNTTDVGEDIFIFTSGSAGFAVTITVNGANDEPVVDTAIVEQGGTAGQSTSIDLSGLFTDPDDDTLTLTVMVLSSDGTTKAALDTIGLAYDSDTQMITGTLIDSGTYTIEVVAEDGNGGSATETFDIVVVEQAIEATAGGSTAAVTEDDETQDPVTGTLGIISGVTSPAIVLNGATDDDNDGTFILESVYGRMEFVMSTGVWTYTLDNTKAETQALNATDVVEDIFIFTSGSAGFAVTITVNGANDEPVVDTDIVEQGGTVGQSTSIDLSGLFTDPDDDTLTLTVMVLSSDGTTKAALDTIGLAYDSDTQMITGTPTGSGTYTIEVVAEDDGGESATSTFDIVVAEQAIEATAGGSTAAVTEDDEAQDSVTGTLGIISGVTSPAIVLNGATDDDNDGTFILESVYGRMEFVMSTGVWTYTLDNTKAETQALNATDVGEDIFIFTSGSAGFAVTITVNGANDNPVVDTAIVEQGGTAGQSTSIDLSGLFTDPDDDTLTLTVMVLSSDGTTKAALDTIGLAYDSDTQMITGTPTDSGTYTIEVVAEDDGGGITAATLNIVVVEQTIEATAGGSTAAVTEDDEAQDSVTGTLGIISGVTSPAIVLNGATDDDNDGTFILEGVYGRMEFVMSTGVWTYMLDNAKAETHALNTTDVGEDIFIFTSGSAGFAVTITVNGANDEPVVDTAIVEQGGTAGQSTSIDLSGLFTDPDDDTLTLTVMVLSSDGTTKAALDTIGLAYDSDTQMITGTPTDSGTYTIEVVAEDDGGESATSTFDIMVAEQAIEATAGGSTAAVTEDDETQNSVTGTLGIISGVTSPAIVLDDATDDDNDGTFILESVYGRMEFVMSTSVWTYTLDNTKAETQALNATDVVEDIFIFTSGSAGFAVTITVNGADENQDPVVDTAIVEQGGTVGQSTSIDLSGLFTDPDGDTFTLTVMVLSSDGTIRTALDTIGLAHDSDTQMITGTPTGSGTYTIEVVAEDGNGGITAATFDIVVAEQTIEATAGGSTAAVTEDDETQNSVTGTLGIISGVTSPAIVLNDATDDDNDGTFILEGVYGRMEFVMSTGVWTYTLDNTKAETEALNATDVVEDIFIFTSGSAGFAVTITVNGADENQDPVVGTALEPQSGVLGQEISIDLGNLFTDPDGDAFTLMVTAGDDGTTALADIGLTYNEDTDSVSGVVTRTITGTPNEIGTYTLTVKAIDNQGGSVTSTFELTLGLPDVTGLTKELGEGVADAAVGVNDAASSQLLIGGDNAQTLNAGLEGDVIFGGRGDDTVTLGDGEDIVIYRYAGASPNDGADTVNGFDLDEDYLVLAHTGGPGSAHSSATEFYGASTGVSLLVDGDGNITGVTFALDSDLTVNFDEAFDASAISNLLDTSFDPAASGVREITSGQDSNAYEAINVILGDSLVLVDFDDIGFELNAGETDLV